MTKSKKQIEIHPAAKLFPMMDEESYQRLKEDIREHGQQEPVTFFQGYLVDGRNRWRACEELGIECNSSEFDEDTETDMYTFVISQNLHRRHLTTSQRTLVASRIATLKHGTNRFTTEVEGQNCPSIDEGRQNCLPIDDAAKLLNVSPRSVRTGRQVVEKASADLIAAVESNAVSVSLAAKLIDECDDKREQSRLAKLGRKAIREFLTPPCDYPEQEDAEEEDDGSWLKRFLAIWDAADDMGKTAIRTFILDQ